jgi:hypothetical protein
MLGTCGGGVSWLSDGSGSFGRPVVGWAGLKLTMRASPARISHESLGEGGWRSLSSPFQGALRGLSTYPSDHFSRKVE